MDPLEAFKAKHRKSRKHRNSVKQFNKRLKQHNQINTQPENLKSANSFLEKYVDILVFNLQLAEELFNIMFLELLGQSPWIKPTTDPTAVSAMF